MEAVQTTLDASEIQELESQLAAMIAQSAADISHNESLDHEQRAEIYSILQALQNDSQSDCQLANVVVTAIAQEAARA
jgi:hypothetical protein